MENFEKLEKLEDSLRLIEKHECLCDQINKEITNKEIHPEEAELRIIKLRKDLLTALELYLNTLEEHDFETIYENALFSHLIDQLKRSFGFNKAMDKYEQVIQKYNEILGDQIITFERSETEDLIYRLNKIYLTRSLCDISGLTVEGDQIVNNLINKYFRPQQ